MFHLAWFTNAQPHGWELGRDQPWSGSDSDPDVWASGEFLVDMARALDRAGFDYLMLEDHVVLEDIQTAMPRLDPVLMVPQLAAATTGLGIVATVSTGFAHPYQIARSFATLDHLTKGRVGWNIVTTSERSAALAFGQDALPEHDDRYARADEFVDITDALWSSWEPTAVVRDEERGYYVDPAKIHPIDYAGTYFRSQGALNTSRSPQGRPVICQAGASPRGRDFGARHADTVLVSTGAGNDVSAMKELRDDIRRRTEDAGRDPDSIKVMFMVTPIISDSEEAAREIALARMVPTAAKIKTTLTTMSHISGHDLFALDLDAPLPTDRDFSTDGHQATFGAFLNLGKDGRTVRQMIGSHDYSSVELVGTPSSVADRMEEVMAEVGGDGFLIRQRPLTRRYIAEITAGLVPELRKRGLVRDRYDHATLRENLMAF